MVLDIIEVFFRNTTYTGTCPNSKIFFLSLLCSSK